MKQISLFLTASFLAIATFAQPIAAKTTITWWQFWTDEGIKPTIDSFVTEFEAAHPDIDVQVTDLTWGNGHEKIVIGLSSGTGPDIFELGSDWIAQFAANNQLADLTSETATERDQSDGWGMATYGGKVYGYPWILGTRVLFGNRDLMTRAGHDTGFVPVTWDDLLKSTKKIQALGKDIYGWGSNAPEKHRLYKKFMPFFWSRGGQLYTPDGKHVVFSSMECIEALKTYRELHDSTGFVGDQRGIEDAFLAGKVGYVMSGDWLLKRIMLEKPNFPLVTTLVPGPKFPGRSFLGGEFLSINAASAQKDSSLLFVRFITSPAQQIRFCKNNFSANPASKAAQADPFFTSNIYLSTFIKQMKLSNHPPVDPDWVEMETAIEDAVEDAVFKKKLVATSLWNAEKKIVKIKTK